MIRPWILPDHEDAIGILQFFQRHRALADADSLAQSVAARFMAHVRTVRQIVRSIHADKELIQKRRFIAGAARRVEDCLIRRGKAFQLLANHLECIAPADPLVVIRAFPQQHRLRQPPLFVQPQIGLLTQRGDTPLFEKLRRHALGSSFGRDRLRAVFAELGHVTVAFRIGPRTTGAIEAVFLISRQQGLRRAHRPHFLQRISQRFHHRR